MSAEDGGPYEGETPNSGDSGGFNLSALVPDGMSFKEVAQVLKSLSKNPAGFVLGAVLTTVLAGVETIVEGFIDGILFLALGEDYVLSTTGKLGVADLPLYIVDLLGGAGSVITTAIVAAVREFNRSAVAFATAAGPLSPLLYAAILALSVVAVAWTLRTALSLLADAIPGLQGLID